MRTLADRIENRIRQIPAHNPSVIDPHPTTLANVLGWRLLRQIAEAAADEVQKPAARHSPRETDNHRRPR